MGYSPWGHREPDTTEQQSMHVDHKHLTSLGARAKGSRGPVSGLILE